VAEENEEQHDRDQSVVGYWDEIIMPADEEPLHENHEEDGKITELESTNAIKVQPFIFNFPLCSFPWKFGSKSKLDCNVFQSA